MQNSVLYMLGDLNIVSTVCLDLIAEMWLYASFIYNCLCNQCLSPLTHVVLHVFITEPSYPPVIVGNYVHDEDCINNVRTITINWKVILYIFFKQEIFFKRIFSSPGLNAMWAFAYTWHPSSFSFSHLNFLLWNHVAKWTETC